MNDRDIVSILSDFLDLVFKIEISQLVNITFLKVINGFRISCPNEQYYEKYQKNLLVHFLRVKILIIKIKFISSYLLLNN